MSTTIDKEAVRSALKKHTSRGMFWHPIDLHRMGIRYCGCGILYEVRNGKRVQMYNYYHVRHLSDQDKAKIKEQYPLVEFFRGHYSYAPETKYDRIAFPKAAKLRETKSAVGASSTLQAAIK